jgi:Short C-terminal domain
VMPPVAGAPMLNVPGLPLPSGLNAERPGVEGDRMPLASSSYPVLSIFWSILEFFLWVIWIWILIMIFIDIFRSHDLSGWAKALWFLFVLLIPLIGVLVYLIVRGGSMHERSVRQAQRDADAFYASYGRHAASGGGDGGGSTADQLAKLADLRDKGVLSPEEFEREKAKLLAA